MASKELVRKKHHTISLSWGIYLVVQNCLWFKFIFLGMVMYDNEFETYLNQGQN